MTDPGAREELKDIARQLRRWVEREQWSGAAEMLLPGVAAVRPAAAAAAAAPGRTPPVAAPPRAATIAAPQRAEAAALRPVPAPAPVTYAPAPTPQPAMVAEPVLVPSDSWEPLEAGPQVMDQPIALPPVHPPLHPIGEARRAIADAALAVLNEVGGEARACQKCGLCKTRTQAVPGVGSAASGIVFVGEAPGADEDAQGEPFVGRAGQLLTAMIQAMDDKRLIPGVKLDRSTVYIANVLKCRPPENRNPLPHEIEQCSPYLKRQLEALQPRIICCLGKFAAELLVGVKSPSLGAMRGKTYRYRGAKLIVTYHPAALLRNPNWKKPAWEDLQRLAAEYQSD